tara:strand:+ start:1060 stop:1416 length:357 start_codon:yes stop_codon:yes gene_type:complete
MNNNINLKIGYIMNNMNTIERIRRYNRLALILVRTDEEQREMERLEALLPNNPANVIITLLREQQKQLERDVANLGDTIESSASIEQIMIEMLSTLKSNLKTAKEIEREYNKAYHRSI